MLDQRYAEQLADYVATRHGVKPPKIILQRTPALGLYANHGLNTIMIDPAADTRVLLHELGHSINVQSRGDHSEISAIEFSEREAKEIGIPLEPMKPYTLTIQTPQPLQLANAIAVNQEALGVRYHGYHVLGNTLYVKVSVAPRPMAYSVGRVEVYSFPILWAIMGLAAIIGVAVISINLGGAAPDITKWIEMIGIFTIVGLSIYAVMKI